MLIYAAYIGALKRPAYHPVFSEDDMQAALNAPGMITCHSLGHNTLLSEKQCLVNQRRCKSYGTPACCHKDCEIGRRVQAKHPGAKIKTVQVSSFHGGVLTAGKEAVTMDAPAPVCPSKRIAREKKKAQVQEFCGCGEKAYGKSGKCWKHFRESL